MDELLLSADEKELLDLRSAVASGNTLVCRVENHSPDYQTKSWTYYFHITASNGKVYYWPETFKDFQASRVFNDIRNEFGDDVSLDLTRSDALKPFFEYSNSNVIPLSFAARA